MHGQEARTEQVSEQRVEGKGRQMEASAKDRRQGQRRRGMSEGVEETEHG